MILLENKPTLGTKMDGPKLYLAKRFEDSRGFFYEKYNKKELDLNINFIQDNVSTSHKNVIRGLHYQIGQAKLVSSLYGDVYDVIVDLRPGSITYKQWAGYILTEHLETLFIPAGFAHGFCCLSEKCCFFYKVNAYYNPKLESGTYFDQFGIEWPIDQKDAILSKRDMKLSIL